ncbi:hypothetical protein [Streptomyces sichuanensis]|uniref:hypothetical protein n=1 Tax=Streptomyces sichuanensis TaxID=2871810 RepID=UPI0021F0934D|nr:hypothetical protein [Streptomyces sichuanensis]
MSKVGDLAQRQALTSGDRMRLVSRLRAEIERRRAAEGADSPTAVQRILDGLGTPAEAVAVAGSGAEGAGRVPVQRQHGETAAARRVPGAALPPHLATEDELRPVSGVHPDGWGLEPGPFQGGDEVHGFVGGIEIPDMLKPPQPAGRGAAEKPEKRRASPAPEPGQDAEEDESEAEDEAGQESSDRRFRFWYSRAGVPMSPLLLLVAVLLVTGAVLGNWLVIVAGWALAYVTRRLTQTESKLAVMGVPGLVVAGGLVWLWGRTNGRWGAPIAEGEMGAALSETLPVVVKVAAVASAAFVLWRARRPG